MDVAETTCANLLQSFRDINRLLWDYIYKFARRYNKKFLIPLWRITKRTSFPHVKQILMVGAW